MLQWSSNITKDAKESREAVEDRKEKVRWAQLNKATGKRFLGNNLRNVIGTAAGTGVGRSMISG